MLIINFGFMFLKVQHVLPLSTLEDIGITALQCALWSTICDDEMVKKCKWTTECFKAQCKGEGATFDRREDVVSAI